MDNYTNTSYTYREIKEIYKQQDELILSTINKWCIRAMFALALFGLIIIAVY